MISLTNLEPVRGRSQKMALVLWLTMEIKAPAAVVISARGAI